MISISPLFIYKSCVLYLIIPIIFFFIGWLRVGIGIILSSLLFLASYIFLKKVKTLVSQDALITLTKEFYITFIILFLFLLSTGNTGFIGSWGVDIPWRNAIYQDLIRQSWPVIYNHSHSILVYYMVFWLVPAEITALLSLNECGSNVVLFIWMYIGLTLIFLLLCDILKVNRRNVILITTLFLFFSGINTFGMIIRGFILEPEPLIFDYPARMGWAFSEFDINGFPATYIIRTIYLCISDVYNQFFPLAISTLLFIKFERNIDFYAFISLLALPYSPIGFIGFSAILVLNLIFNSVGESILKDLSKKFKQVFSYINLLAIVSIVPVFFFYFSMNSHASKVLAPAVSSINTFLYVPLDQYNLARVFLLIIYYYLYFLIYAWLINDYYKKDKLYWIILFCMIIFPFFKVGSGEDFNFNATICPYLILFVFIAKYLLKVLNNGCLKMKDLVLVFCLSIAILTPVAQISTAFRGAYINNTICRKWSPWSSSLCQDSFRDKDIKNLRNFLSDHYEEQFFYKYLARK